MDTKPTPQQLAGANALNAIKQARQNLPLMAEMFGLKAVICYSKYQEALQAGFTDAQALEICTKPWAVE